VNVLEYARIFHLLLTGQGSGVPVDFSEHSLVAVGHSSGANALLLTTTFPSAIRWHSMIVVEPVIFTESARKKKADFLVKNALNRKDVWTSKQDAYEYLSHRPGFKSWDQQVLRSYVVCLIST
jgi:hypothetical protein